MTDMIVQAVKAEIMKLPVLQQAAGAVDGVKNITSTLTNTKQQILDAITERINTTKDDIMGQVTEQVTGQLGQVTEQVNQQVADGVQAALATAGVPTNGSGAGNNSEGANTSGYGESAGDETAGYGESNMEYTGEGGGGHSAAGPIIYKKKSGGYYVEQPVVYNAQSGGFILVNPIVGGQVTRQREAATHVRKISNPSIKQMATRRSRSTRRASRKASRKATRKGRRATRKH